jgi:hypothetical protein
VSIFGLLLLVILILLLTGGIPVGDSRNTLLTILVVLIVAWLLMAFASPWGYPTRGWVVW